MKTYYFEMSNGDYDFIDAKNDSSAYSKSSKIAKSQGSKVIYLAEQTEDETDRVVEL